jgi:hypothetical protein
VIFSLKSISHSTFESIWVQNASVVNKSFNGK